MDRTGFLLVYRLFPGEQDRFPIGLQAFTAQVDRAGFLLVYRLSPGGQDRFPIGLQTFFRWTGQFPLSTDFL